MMCTPYDEMMIVSYFVVSLGVDEVEKFMYKTMEGISRKVDVLTNDDMRKCAVWVE